MTQNFEKTTVSEGSEPSEDTLKIGIYSIYDCVLKQFQPPFCIPISKVNDYMNILVNDVNSPFYNHESDYILNKIADFNQDIGEINIHFIERVSILDSYINVNKRKLQTIIQTLNYLPSGYFKMPAEQKQDIQEKIDSAIYKYVEDYVIPDLDVNNNQDNIIISLQNKIKSLEKQLCDVS